MFVAKDFVFIHIPKTGGQTILRMLEDMYGIFQGTSARYHMDVNNVKHPGFKVDTPRLALVRNPWSWYASWYHFLSGGKQHSALFDTISDNSNNTFIESINNMFDMNEGNRPDLVEQYTERLKTTNHPTETHRDNFHQLAEWNCGLLSWNYYYLIFGDKANINYTNVTIGKQESLAEDVFAFFVDQSIIEKDSESKRKRIGHEMVKRILSPNFRINATKDYGDFRQYYDDSLVERVYEKEKYIVDRYGYKFESTP